MLELLSVVQNLYFFRFKFCLLFTNVAHTFQIHLVEISAQSNPFDLSF